MAEAAGPSKSREDAGAGVPAKPCRIVELLQYSCEAKLAETGTHSRVHCFPIPRILRICEGRPAVEITSFVKIDSETGAVEVPPESSHRLPKGRPWRDVYRYPSGRQHNLHHEPSQQTNVTISLDDQ